MKKINRIMLTLTLTAVLALTFCSAVWAGEIHKAAMAGDVSRLKELLNDKPGIIDSEYDEDDFRGFTPLMFAVMKGKIKAADYLIDRGANVNTPVCISPLHLAIFKGDRKMAALLIKRGADVNLESGSNSRYYLNENEIPKQFELIEYEIDDYTPLLAASLKNDVETAKLLIKSGADVNKSYIYHRVKRGGITPLHAAACLGNREVLMLLLENGAKLLQCDANGRSEFYYAVIGNHPEILKIFLKRLKRSGSQVSIYRMVEMKELLLCYAAGLGNTETVKLLLDTGWDINSADESGNTPLILSFINEHPDTFKLLMREGADVNIKNKSGHSLMYIALFSDDPAFMEYLVSQGGKFDDEPYLHAAAKHGLIRNVACLIDKGFSIEAKDYYGHTPLVYAVRNRQPEVVRLLVQKGADLNVLGSELICVACENYDKQVVSILMKEKLDVNSYDSRGKAAIHYAAESYYDPVINRLHLLGADLNFPYKYGELPIEYAVRSNRTGNVRYLIENGVSIGQLKPEVKYSMLRCAVRNRNLEICKILVNNGVDVNLKLTGEFESVLNEMDYRSDEYFVRGLLFLGAKVDDARNGPLIKAVKWGRIDLIKLYIRNGADVNGRDSCGRTPLFYCPYGKDDVAELLISNGASVRITDDFGMTPLYLMEINGDRKVFKVIKKQYETFPLHELFLAVKGEDKYTFDSLVNEFSDIRFYCWVFVFLVLAPVLILYGKRWTDRLNRIYSKSRRKGKIPVGNKV